VQNVNHPFKGVKYMNFQFAYSLSRFVNSGSNTCSPSCTAGGDQDFVNNALDNRNPNSLSGPGSLDRTHQFNLGGYADLPLGFRIGILSHFWSPLALTPFTLPVAPVNNTGAAGGIFQTDFIGSGQIGNPLPTAETSASCGTVGGTCDYRLLKVGAFMRQIGPAGLTRNITNYNTSIADSCRPSSYQCRIGDSCRPAGDKCSGPADRSTTHRKRRTGLAEGFRHNFQLGRACLARETDDHSERQYLQYF
jgi:hypothetical protein